MTEVTNCTYSIPNYVMKSMSDPDLDRLHFNTWFTTSLTSLCLAPRVILGVARSSPTFNSGPDEEAGMTSHITPYKCGIRD